MKILLITSSLDSGGAETHIFELAKALSDRSHDICVLSSGGRTADSLSLLGIRHISAPLNSKKPSDLLRSLKLLRHLLKKEGFDVVHVHSRISAFLCRLILRKRKYPVVVSTVHARFRVGPLTRRLSYWGSASIAVSEDLGEYLHKKYGFPSDRITLIPNAIDVNRFSPSHRKSGAPRKILFVSRLDSDCSLGASLLCRIAPELSRKYPDVKIEIAGGGKEYKKLLARAERINKELGYTCITLCGYVKSIEEKLCEADVFVGVSRAALEAMSCGVPTVLCGNEGFLGIIDSSSVNLAARTNFCCRGSELPTSLSLLESISVLLDMKESERRALGKYLRSYVCRNHGKKALAEQTERFYQKALEIPHTPRKGIVLCGYYGFGNIGDDAILIAAIDKIKRESPDKRITVIAHSPRHISRRFGVSAIDRANFFAISKRLGDAERLVFGGGSVLQNATSDRSLLYYTSLIRLAARRGASVELWSNGLGPLNGRRAEKRTAKALKLCSRLSFRDRISARLATSLGCDSSRILIEDDLSALIAPCDKTRLDTLLKDKGIANKNFFLIAVCGKTKKELLQKIEAEIGAQKRSGLLPVFVIMHPREDKKTSRRLAKKFRGICLSSLSPSELAGLVGRAEFAIGNRYHLLYLAKRAKTPIIPFGNDPKLLGLKE